MTGEPEAGRAEAVAKAVETLAGRTGAGAPERLVGGFANETWVAGLGGGRVLLRIAAADADMGKVRAAWAAQELAHRAGVPTGEPIAFVERCDLLGGRAVRLVGFVEGHDPEDVLADDASASRFFGSLGTLVAGLHEVARPRFCSRIDESSESFDSWRDYVDYRVPAVARRSVRAGAFSEGEVSEVLSPLSQLAGLVASSVSPALTHRDLHLHNVVASADGEAVGLLDWDAAEAWDPAADFVKLRWQVFDRFPGGAGTFFEAYEARRGAMEMLRERLHVVDLLELTNNVANARLEGQADYEEHNRAALAEAIARFG